MASLSATSSLFSSPPSRFSRKSPPLSLSPLRSRSGNRCSAPLLMARFAVDTQTIIVSASVLAAVSLSLLLGLKVIDAILCWFDLSWLFFFIVFTFICCCIRIRVVISGRDWRAELDFAGGACSLRQVWWKR